MGSRRARSRWETSTGEAPWICDTRSRERECSRVPCRHRRGDGRRPGRRYRRRVRPSLDRGPSRRGNRARDREALPRIGRAATPDDRNRPPSEADRVRPGPRGTRPCIDRGLSAARASAPSHVAVRKMLSEAVRLGKVGRNVSDDARPPRPKSTRAQSFKVWTYPETVRFLAAIESDRDHAAYTLVAMTGLRQGEVVALQWESVDLDAGTLTVERSIGKGMEGNYSKAPKSDAGRRTLELDPEDVRALRAHRKAQAARRLAIGSGWRDNGLVFCEVDGSPIRPERLSKRWSDLVRRVAPTLGLPTIRFHDLRHSHATALLAAGVRADVVSERLGHSSVAFTLSNVRASRAGRPARRSRSATTRGA